MFPACSRPLTSSSGRQRPRHVIQRVRAHSWPRRPCIRLPLIYVYDTPHPLPAGQHPHPLDYRQRHLPAGTYTKSWLKGRVLSPLQLPKDKSLPPVVWHWFPWFGSAAAYGEDPIKFFFDCKEKVRNTLIWRAYMLLTHV